MGEPPDGAASSEAAERIVSSHEGRHARSRARAFLEGFSAGLLFGGVGVGAWILSLFAPHDAIAIAGPVATLVVVAASIALAVRSWKGARFRVYGLVVGLVTAPPLVLALALAAMFALGISPVPH